MITAADILKPENVLRLCKAISTNHRTTIRKLSREWGFGEDCIRPYQLAAAVAARIETEQGGRT